MGIYILESLILPSFFFFLFSFQKTAAKIRFASKQRGASLKKRCLLKLQETTLQQEQDLAAHERAAAAAATTP